MLILREHDLKMLQSVLDEVCVVHDTLGRKTYRSSLAMAALVLYRKGFQKPETLVRLLRLTPAPFQHR